MRKKMQRGLFFLLFATSSLLLAEERGFSGKCKSGQECTESFELYDENLRAFVSFSMPDAVLLSLSHALEKTGGTLVFRGIPNNSFQEFAKKILELKEKGMGAQVSIDPESFENLKIKNVPTFALSFQESADTISGNVSLRYALLEFSERGETQQKAKEILLQLDRGF